MRQWSQQKINPSRACAGATAHCVQPYRHTLLLLVSPLLQRDLSRNKAVACCEAICRRREQGNPKTHDMPPLLLRDGLRAQLIERTSWKCCCRHCHCVSSWCLLFRVVTLHYIMSCLRDGVNVAAVSNVHVICCSCLFLAVQSPADFINEVNGLLMIKLASICFMHWSRLRIWSCSTGTPVHFRSLFIACVRADESLVSLAWWLTTRRRGSWTPCLSSSQAQSGTVPSSLSSRNEASVSVGRSSWEVYLVWSV
jgi:hypothetical protein